MFRAQNEVRVLFVWVVIVVQLESLMTDQVFLPGESRYVELRFRFSVVYMDIQYVPFGNMSVFKKKCFSSKYIWF